MLPPILAVPVSRRSGTMPVPRFDGLAPAGSCDDCIATCVKVYSKDPRRYAACCQTCGEDYGKVCWYKCCHTGPGCSVPS